MISAIINVDLYKDEQMNLNEDFEQLKNEASDHYQAYVDYSKLLRVWLVAYGIGAPIIFLTNDALWKAIAKNELSWVVAAMFLAGVFLQISIAWLNKTTQWLIYSGKNKPPYPNTWIFTTARKIGRQFWIDVAADLASIILFTIATGCLFNLLLAGHR